MKVKDLKFDRNLISELTRGNRASNIIEAELISQYKHVVPNVIFCDELDTYSPKTGQIKVDPPIHFFWLNNEENEAPQILRTTKKGSANYCTPSDWDFYSIDDVELTMVIGKTVKVFGEVVEKWIVPRFYITKK